MSERKRKAPGKRRVRIPMMVQDVILAVLAAICFTTAGCLAIKLFKEFLLCVW